MYQRSLIKSIAGLKCLVAEAVPAPAFPGKPPGKDDSGIATQVRSGILDPLALLDSDEAKVAVCEKAGVELGAGAGAETTRDVTTGCGGAGGGGGTTAVREGDKVGAVLAVGAVLVAPPERVIATVM